MLDSNSSEFAVFAKRTAPMPGLVIRDLVMREECYKAIQETFNGEKVCFSIDI